jgi:hypothetical protein
VQELGLDAKAAARTWRGSVIAEASAPTADDIVQWLAPTVETGSVIELRALNCVDNPKYGAFTVAGFFDSDHLPELARAALQVTAQAEGVYVTMNPVNTALMARAANRVVKIKKDLATKDPDIVRRTQLVFDCDPTRPAGISATDAEKALALEKATLLTYDLTGRGWPEPILADSGNGYHVKYRIDLANNDGSLELVKTVLATANQLFGDEQVKIDVSLSNASRIIKLSGTMARKGDDIPDRPHRRSRLISAPSELLVVPTDRLESFAALFVPKNAAVNGQHQNGHSGKDPFMMTVPPSGGASPEVRARAYVFSPKFPDSIGGQNGHGRLYHVAALLVDGFGLSRQEAMPILREWNQTKAQPSEDEGQINHKLDDAIKKHPVPSLEKLNADRGGAGRNGSTTTANAAAAPETDADIDNAEVLDRWPTYPTDAFYGLAGKVVALADPHCEGDPVATLVQFLVGFGNLIDRRMHFVVGATKHYLNLLVLLIGATAVGRKGTSWDVSRHILEQLDSAWVKERIQSGLVSGEGLIYHVRDPVFKEKRDKAGKPTGEIILVDEGSRDKRLLVVETEMARVLKAMNRDGNTLSEVIRQVFDSGNLGNLAKNSANRATDVHVSIIGHVTSADVRKHLTETDTANGFANRFIWAAVRRSKLLPDGGNLLDVDWSPIQSELSRVIRIANGSANTRMTRDTAARKAWHSIYEELSSAKHGVAGKILSRAEAQVMRLACVYAVLDGSDLVRIEHLKAAGALWEYCEASVRLVFGDALGDPNTTKLLAALNSAPGGLTKSEIYATVFNRKKKAAELAGILSDLLTQGLIHRKNDASTGGRKSERWFPGKEMP